MRLSVDLLERIMFKRKQLMRLALPALCAICLYPFASNAQEENDHDHDDHSEFLHFSHPLISESPSPDTKIRFNYEFEDFDGEEDEEETTIELEAEYAFNRHVSLEVVIPYVFADRHDDEIDADGVGNVSVAVKFANFAFEERNILLGYGIELALPTGSDRKAIGSNHEWEIEPFFSFGYRYKKLEIVSFLSIGVEFNEEPEEAEDEATKALGYNLSFLYQFNGRFAGLFEFDGETALDGDEEGDTVFNVTPGFKVKPWKNRGLEFGLGASVPITSHKEFDGRFVASVFYHF